MGRPVSTGGLADPDRRAREAQRADIGFNSPLNRLVKMDFDWEHAELAIPVACRPGAFRLTNDLYWLRFRVYFQTRSGIGRPTRRGLLICRRDPPSSP